MQNKTLRLQHVHKGNVLPVDAMVEKKTRLRFWEVSDFFKCPVVGMCLTFAEQQQVLKKTDLPVKKASPFEIHEALVASAESENHLSRRVDSLLQRKFGKKAAGLLMLAHNDFMDRFKAMEASGDLPAVLWAAAIHPDLPASLKRDIFGVIHMSMHWSGEQRMKMSHKLTRTEATLADAQRRIKDVAQKKRNLEKENACLAKSQAGLKATLKALKDQNNQLETVMEMNHPGELNDLEQENRILKAELESAYRRLEEKQRQIVNAREKNDRLAAQAALNEKLNNRYQQEARATIAEMVSLNRCDTNCPSFDLCKKRILIVGGISRMESLFRDLIEGSGGILEYHDGYMKRGSRGLESRLKRADMVLCPVSCNSHTACSVVKNLAKKYNKTVHMLANSSLKTISRAIWGNANDNRNTFNTVNPNVA